MKKRILIWIMIGALLFTNTYHIHTVSASSENIIRVKVSVGGKSIDIVVDGEYIINEKPSISIPRGSYTISVSNNNVRIKGPNVDEVIGSSLTLLRGAYKGAGNNHITIRGTEHGNINYLGDFVFTVNAGNLQVVNHIPLEQYLYGVVAYEMSDSFPLEALKVQAVSARGYAVMAKSSSGSYDIGDTATDQVYKGYNPSHKNVINAIHSTVGEVLSYNNKIVPTYYSASNGGQTELPGNMWGGGSAKNAEYPYLAQRDDPYDLENPSSLYQKIFVPRQVEGTSHDADNIPGDYIVRIVNVNDFCNVRSGPGTSYSIVGQAPVNSVYEWLGVKDGWNKVRFNGQEAYIIETLSEKIPNSGKFIYANNVLSDIQSRAHTRLQAQGIEIASATDVKIITVDKLENGQERWAGSGSRSYVSANASATVRYYKKGSSELSNQTNVDVSLDLMYKSQSGSYIMAHNYLNSNLRLRGVEQASSEGGYYITNGRYGHGIGMSQRGAQTMAGKYNMSYKEILAFYFKGTTIMNVGSSIPDLPDHANNPTLTSREHTIQSNMITGLSPNLSVDQFLSKLSVTNGTVRLSSGGKTKTSGIVATGDILQLRNSAGSVYREYPLVIYGDVNGDGNITAVDLLRIQRYLLGTISLDGAFLSGADVSKDGKVTALDLLRTQRHLLRTQTITQ